MSESKEIKSEIKLANIKSIYIAKRITSFIKEVYKLKMIIYNKTLQKLWKININDYKRVSGKFIKFENDGKITEYIVDTNIVIFKGEYLNKKRNGKGIEYFQNGKIKFEGEFLNGKRNGKGKEYNKNGLIYEGEYLNGKKHGKGKEYDKHKKLNYEGEYLNGKKHGKGKEYDKSGIFFEVEYLNGEKIKDEKENKKENIKKNVGGKNFTLIKKRKEFKKEYHYNGKLKFEGEYLNGLRNGKGKEYDILGNLLFEGEYINGIRNGKGKEYDIYGDLLFEGGYLYGKRWNGIIKYYLDQTGKKLLGEGIYVNGVSFCRSFR